MDKKTIFKLSAVIIISLAIGFFAGMEYKAYEIRSALSKSFNNTEESTNTLTGLFADDENEQVEQEKVIEKNIGDEVQLATINFKVNSSEEIESYGIPFSSPVVPKQGTKLIVVNLDITNTTKEPFYFGGYEAGAIIDDQDRIFQPHDEFLGDKGLGSDLAPNISRTGDVLFEIPEDAVSYSFAMAKSGTNEIYKIKLK